MSSLFLNAIPSPEFSIRSGILRILAKNKEPIFIDIVQDGQILIERICATMLKMPDEHIKKLVNCFDEAADKGRLRLSLRRAHFDV